MGVPRDALDEALAPLAGLVGVEGVAIVARDGLLLAARLPAGVDHFTFGAMSATLLGAATTAAYEFRVKPPSRFTIDLGGWRLVAAEAGEVLVVAVVGCNDAPADEAIGATALRVRALLGG
ncbi:MAG TPA: roadblock/LC7 domain-containing protein [Candidatus Thermoplasmatota archaeon]|jgi:hypothetical protein|nr:roadblock/LC7 domain-containing protein [Candidatus Thermoplasmatota archaeon]